jgi:SAM-dependent methyltransferase
MTLGKQLLNEVHNKLVFRRRVKVLSTTLSEFLTSGSVLDVGTGDGLIASLIVNDRHDLSIEGVDVLKRPKTHIPVSAFNGSELPFADDSFDCVMFVDVLHHTNEPEKLLIEAARVSRNSIVIKDHLLEGWLAGATLRLMDWVGNRGHDVVLPYNYLTRSRWHHIFREANLEIAAFSERLNLYPAPASWLFDRNLHFVARLSKAKR